MAKRPVEKYDFKAIGKSDKNSADREKREPQKSKR